MLGLKRAKMREVVRTRCLPPVTCSFLHSQLCCCCHNTLPIASLDKNLHLNHSAMQWEVQLQKIKAEHIYWMKLQWWKLQCIVFLLELQLALLVLLWSLNFNLFHWSALIPYCPCNMYCIIILRNTITLHYNSTPSSSYYAKYVTSIWNYWLWHT